MAPAHRLRLLQMGIPGHDVVDLTLRARDRHAHQVRQAIVQLAQLVAQPQTHIRCDLLVARAAGVQLPADLLADDLAEPALVGGVDVLVVLFGDEAVGAPLLGDLGEAALDLGELIGAQDTGFGVGAREGQRAGNILVPQDAVVGQRHVVLHHEGVEALCCGGC